MEIIIIATSIACLLLGLRLVWAGADFVFGLPRPQDPEAKA